jgi:thiol:disulfide interchange protein
MKQYSLFLLTIIALLTFTVGERTAFGVGDPKPKLRLESKLLSDSTIFTLSVDPKIDYFPGKIFAVKLTAKHNKNWHIYSSTMSPDAGPVPLAVSVPAELASMFELVGLKEHGKIVSNYDSNFSAVTKAYYGNFEIVASVRIKKLASVGKTPFTLTTSFMTCSESQCLPNRSFVVPMLFLGQKPIELTIVPTPKDSLVYIAKEDTATKALAVVAPTDNTPTEKVTPPTAPKATTVASADIVAIASHSLWEFIFAAAGFGLLALLTPCVFPRVPITVSFFTKRNAGSRKEAVKDATLYALGIIVTFVALGFILSLIAGPSGINKFAANPWANLLIAGIFITFALNLFGLFEIGVPGSVLTKLNSTAQNSKSRTFSVVLMGFVFSLTSFTCTVPFVGTLMVAFSRGSWFVPLIGMVVFAGVFALPFFILALFPSWMKALPRSGGWLNSVKVVMGFLEIAAALKFFSNVDLIWNWNFFSRDLVLAAWVAIAVLTTMYLLGRFRLSHDTPIEHLGALRVLLAVGFLSIGVYLYTGINGKPLGQLDAFLPPTAAVSGVTTSSTGGTIAATEAKWFGSYTDALAEAKRTGKNVFIDFTGYTCTNCRAMEASMFSRPDVKDLFQDFVLARLYTDNGTPLNDSNRTMEETRFSTIALPYYVIMSPDDKSLETFPGYTRDDAAFKTFLTTHRKPAMSVAMLGK